MRKDRVFQVLFLIVVSVFLFGSCRRGGSMPASIDSKSAEGKDVRFGMRISDLHMTPEGDLVGLLSLYNDSGFPVLLRIPIGGPSYNVDISEVSYDSAGELTGVDYFPLGFGGSDAALGTEYQLPSESHGAGKYPVDSVYTMDICVVSQAKYRQFLDLVAKTKRHLYVEISINLFVLCKCDAVSEKNAEAIMNGQYERCELVRRVDLLSASWRDGSSPPWKLSRQTDK